VTVWNGVPPNTEPGWHLLRRKPSAYSKPPCGGREEAYHYNSNRRLPWERREDCLRKGYSHERIAREWEYAGRLVLEGTS